MNDMVSVPKFLYLSKKSQFCEGLLEIVEYKFIRK